MHLEVDAMPISKEILEVDRPTNTVVIAYGKDKSRYEVRQRVGCKSDGGRRLPVNGLTIGHISRTHIIIRGVVIS